MRQALVFGGSGQIGAGLLAALQAAGWNSIAVSRQAQADAANLQWLRGDLAAVAGLPASVDAIFSCGPLDHFARWYATTAVEAPRVIAFGSTSVVVKGDSIDAGERDVARRLAEGERVVFDVAGRRRAGAVVLRPTLVYGAGRDRTLTRIAAVGRRWGRMVLPRDALGRRQPVHVDDLVVAALAACEAAAAPGRAYDLPGGETLPYRDMVARVLAALQPPARLIEVPPMLFDGTVRLAHACGRAGALSTAVLERMRTDLVFDVTPARRDLGYAPRVFQPTARMFNAD